MLTSDSGLTKRIIAEKSQAAVTAIFKHSTIAPKTLLSHAGLAVNDKSVQSRQYGLGHVRTLLESRTSSRPCNIESIPGMAKDVEQLVKRGLGDTNPQVREQARLTFWCFNQVWPREGSALLESLDGAARKQLDKVNPRLAEKPVEAKPAPKKPRASSAMTALLAAKRAQAAQRSATASPQDELLPTSPDKQSSALPTHVHPSSTPDPAGDDVHAAQAQESSAVSAVHPAVDDGENVVGEALYHDHPHEREPAPTAVASTSVPKDQATLPLSSNGQDHARQIPVPKVTSPRSPASKPGVKTSSPSFPSSRSRSPSLGRTLSHSPPSRPEPLHVLRNNSRTVVAGVNAPPIPHTPVRPMVPKSRVQSLSTVTPRQHMRSFDERSLTSAALLAHQTPGDAVEEARRAQAAQGISAAEQLLDYDDDDQQVAMQPMTPLRHTIAPSFTTPLPSRLQRQVWEDSPKAVTPKLMKQLQNRPHERSWWNERRCCECSWLPRR